MHIFLTDSRFQLFQVLNPYTYLGLWLNIFNLLLNYLFLSQYCIVLISAILKYILTCSKAMFILHIFLYQNSSRYAHMFILQNEI